LKMQLLSAVSHLHAACVLHRDLKPSNILVTTDETGIIQFLVADLGRARDVSLPQVRARVGSKVRAVVPSKQGAVGRSYFLTPGVGTAAYAAPEFLSAPRWDGTHVSDAVALGVTKAPAGKIVSATTSADVWSLGCIFFEALTGEFFVYGSSRDEDHLLAAIASRLGRRSTLKHCVSTAAKRGKENVAATGTDSRRLLTAYSAIPSYGLISEMLIWEPPRRPDCAALLRHHVDKVRCVVTVRTYAKPRLRWRRGGHANDGVAAAGVTPAMALPPRGLRQRWRGAAGVTPTMASPPRGLRQ
jgi:serine/threonine protein kinase